MISDYKIFPIIKYISHAAPILLSSRNSKYILSPNQNSILSAADQRNNAINNDKGVQLNIINYRYDDFMDETDFSTFPTPEIPQKSSSSASSTPIDMALRPSRVFCCGDALTNVKSLLPRPPGGAVQVVTGGHNSSQRRYAPEEVGERSTDSTPQVNGTLARRRSSVKANGTSAHSSPPSSVSKPATDSQSTSLSQTPLAHPPTPSSSSSSSTHLLVADHKGHVKFLSDNHLDELGSCTNEPRNHPPIASANLSSTSGRLIAATATSGGGRISSSSGADDDEEEEDVSAESMPSTSDRTQDDLIEFVFTSHGIRVISDKEYVV